jgi:hypothetical protein
MGKQGVSGREYATMIGKHHSWVSRMVRSGKLPALADGSLDPVACNAARQVTAKIQEIQGADYRKALAERTHLQAEVLRRDLAERDGDLISKADVIQLWQRTAIACKIRLLGIPRKVATQLAAQKSAAKVEALLRTELYEALQGIADYLGEYFQGWGDEHGDNAIEQEGVETRT